MINDTNICIVNLRINLSLMIRARNASQSIGHWCTYGGVRECLTLQISN